MKIASVAPVGKKKVYDLSVEDVEHYVLENGIVTHNTGVYYSADNIFIIGRQQEKEGTDVVGYNFIINIEKSRYVREKSKIPVEVLFEGGISKWSGLLDVALEGGFVIKPSNGWYQRAGEEQKYRAKETYTKDFWLPILASKEFQEFIVKTYQVSSSDLMGSRMDDEDIDSEYEKIGA